MSPRIARCVAALGVVAAMQAESAGRAAAPEKDKNPPPPTGNPGEYEHALFVLAPHAGLGSRRFGYTQGVTPGLRPYDLSAAPLVGLRGELYPFSHGGSALASAFGIEGEYTRSLGLESALADGSRLDSTWSNVEIALRGRIPLGSHVLVGPRIGYGRLAFSYGPAPRPNMQLPDVGYDYGRAGIDARVAAGRFALYANLDYLGVQGAGAVADRFPHASVGGIDGGLLLGFALFPHVEARTGLLYQRLFYDFHAQPTDSLIVGGALDEFARWDTSVAFHY